MIKRTHRIFNRKDKAGFTDRISRKFYWLLFLPIYIKDEIISNNR